jgi:hypothetical protein
MVLKKRAPVKWNSSDYFAPASGGKKTTFCIPQKAGWSLEKDARACLQGLGDEVPAPTILPVAAQKAYQTEWREN